MICVKIMNSNEKYVGVSLGFCCSYFLYFLLSIDYYSLKYISQIILLEGISGFESDFNLNCLCCCLFAFCSFLWFCLAFDILLDPGIVDTRKRDFDNVSESISTSFTSSIYQVLEESFCGTKIPSAQKYCLTTLMKKPLRYNFGCFCVIVTLVAQE